jgi:integrase
MNDDGDDKRLKTDAAKRLVPIHKELLNLGILEEVERLRKQGHTRFLHELRFCKKNGYGKKLGHYFNQVLMPNLGLKKQAHVEVYHALRHTAVTRLYQAGVPQPIVESIVGHERSGTSQQVYFREGYKLEQLQEAMDKFDPLAA